MDDDGTAPATLALGTRYEMVPAPPVAADTQYVDAGAVRIGVEYRVLTDDNLLDAYADDPRGAAIVQAAKLPVVDESGVSLHVMDTATGNEVLRFDLLDDHPHYHYVNPGGFNTVVAYDEAASGPMLEWALAALEHRLPAMLQVAGAHDLAARVDDAALRAAIPRVAEIARRARLERTTP